VTTSQRKPPVTTHDWSAEVDAGHIAEIRAGSERFSRGGITHLVLEVLAYSLDEAHESTRERCLGATL
jgi:topoisomerase IV subunit B